MEYGVQIYTLRNELTNISGVQDAFRYIKSIGIDKVELAAMPKAADIDIKKAAMDAGIAIVSTHSDFRDIRKHMPELIRSHFVYGADIIGIGGMPGKYRRSLKGVSKFVEIFNRAADEAARYGMKLCYHNHAFEFENVSGTVLFDYLLEHLNRNVVFCVDCYWADYAGQDVVPLLEKVGDRLALMHFKDSTGREKGGKMCALGTGVLNFADYIAAGERLGARYALIELDESRDPRADIRTSAQYLKQLNKGEASC